MFADRNGTGEFQVLKQGSDPGRIRALFFRVSAAHSCHHGNRSLKGSNGSARERCGKAERG